MKSKLSAALIMLIVTSSFFAVPQKTFAADQQIYLACSNDIQPASNWLDIYPHILVQAFPIRDENLLINSVGVRLNNRGSSVLVHAMIYTEDQHYVKQTATYVSGGNNWTYFYFGDKPIPVGSYHLWLWTNDGEGVGWGYANSASCDPYGNANIDAINQPGKDMAYAIYVKVVDPINGSILPRSRLPHLQINLPQLIIAGTTAQSSASSGTNQPDQSSSQSSGTTPETAPSADQLNSSQINPDPGSVPIVNNATAGSSSNTGTLEKIKDKVVSIFKPKTETTEKPKDTWIPPTNDEILRMTYGDDYKNAKTTGFFPGTLLSIFLFPSIGFIFLVFLIILVIIIRRRRTKPSELKNDSMVKTDNSKTDKPESKLPADKHS